MAEASGHSRGAAVFVLALATTASGPAAALWTVTPEITVRETYTDNVFVGSPSATSDFVTQVTPSIGVSGTSPRLKGTFRYSPTALFYAQNPSQDYIANNLFAQGTLTAVERFFFVDVNGSVTQNFVTPFAPQPGDLVNITPNRSETRTLGLSPYIRSQFGRAFSYEVRNRNIWTRNTTNFLADAHTSGWSATAASIGTEATRLGWALDYDQSDISYGQLAARPDLESKLFRARLLAQATPELLINLNAGREENNYVLQQEKSYYIRGYGAVWRPGPRTTAEAQYESRYFGPYRLFRLNHRTRATAWNVSYSRDASSYQQQLLTLPPGNTAALLDQIFAARISDPVQRQAAVEQFMRSSGTPPFLANPLAFYTQQIFVHESLEASVGVLGLRNSVTFTAFASKSSTLPDALALSLPDNFAIGRTVKQKGFAVNATHQLAPFTTLGASARRTFAYEEERLLSDTRNDFYTVTLNHTVSPKTSTFAGLSYTRFVSALSTPSNNARSAFVGLNHRF